MADWKNVHLAEQDEKIADLTRRLAEAEECLTIAHMDGYHKGQKAGQSEHNNSVRMGQYILEAKTEKRLRESAEARVRELELDNAGRFEHIVKVEAERDALRERCEKLEWLVEVQEFYMYRLRNPGGWSTPGMERAKIGAAWQRRSAANDELRAMYLDALAATEVKP